MKKGDTQLRLPQTVYTDTKTNIEALAGVVAGAHAYATDTDEPGWYDGAAWQWGAAGAYTEDIATVGEVVGYVEYVFVPFAPTVLTYTVWII